MAVTRGFDKIVKWIIEDLGDVTWREEEVLLTYWAVERGDRKILEILSRNGAVWNEDWKVDKMAFLQKAVKDGNVKAVETIVTRKYFKENDWIPARMIAQEKAEKGHNNWISIYKIFKNAEDKKRKEEKKNKNSKTNDVPDSSQNAKLES